MRTIKILTLLLIISIFTTSCYKRNGWGIKGRGETVSEIRNIGGFDRIHLSIDADVEYRIDSVYYLEVSAQPNILSVLRTEVRGTDLRIDYQRNVWQHKKVKMIIHSPAVREFNLSGSGNITVKNGIQGPQLDVTVSGSGNITVPTLSVTSVSVKISGSGDVGLLGGQCQKQQLTISGSGDIDSHSCRSDSNTSTISGSGNITANVSETLNVRISGSGDVKYSGKPSVTADISGSGKLIQIK